MRDCYELMLDRDVEIAAWKRPAGRNRPARIVVAGD